ncbi:MAG: hypothetical protein Ct9H300mP1_35560 [Planctomycetaceae bacterium]|nr:MAG: hypothetical protein Ct9H300mP1_35560 [Planctomycetaceae bacterium]
MLEKGGAKATGKPGGVKLIAAIRKQDVAAVKQALADKGPTQGQDPEPERQRWVGRRWSGMSRSPGCCWPRVLMPRQEPGWQRAALGSGIPGAGGCL